MTGGGVGGRHFAGWGYTCAIGVPLTLPIHILNKVLKHTNSYIDLGEKLQSSIIYIYFFFTFNSVLVDKKLTCIIKKGKCYRFISWGMIKSLLHSSHFVCTCCLTQRCWHSHPWKTTVTTISFHLYIEQSFKTCPFIDNSLQL